MSSLPVEEDKGAVPLVAVTKAGFPAWRERAPAHERDWVDAIGFAGETGKLALLPGSDGRLGRVLAGIAAEQAPIWALAGLPRMLPPGRYRIDEMPEGGDPTRFALGWTLGTYRFGRYRAKSTEQQEEKVELVWPCGADRHQVKNLAAAVFLARDLINTPASDMGPAELAEAALAVAEQAGARHRVVADDRLLDENYPTIHAVGRASTRPPRLVDIVWGEDSAPKVTLVGKGVCFDTGGLDLKPASGMRMM